MAKCFSAEFTTKIYITSMFFYYRSCLHGGWWESSHMVGVINHPFLFKTGCVWAECCCCDIRVYKAYSRVKFNIKHMTRSLARAYISSRVYSPLLNQVQITSGQKIENKGIHKLPTRLIHLGTVHGSLKCKILFCYTVIHVCPLAKAQDLLWRS